MEQFRFQVPGIRIETRDEVQNFYRAAADAAEKLQLEGLEVSAYFSFKVENNTFSCNSIGAFVERTYGLEGFELIALELQLRSRGEEVLSVRYLCDFTVSARDEDLLHRFAGLLKQADIGPKALGC